MYLDHEAVWPHSKKRAGRWVGVAHNIGDTLTYWIYDEQSKCILAHSIVQPYRDNARVNFDSRALEHGSSFTAHSGGDNRPSNDVIQDYLNQSMDRYDEQEEEPQPH